MNSTNYVNILQHFIQHPSHHTHTHTRTNICKTNDIQLHEHTHTGKAFTESRGEKMGPEDRFK